MPRRHLRPKGYDRNRSLGWLAVWWIETFVVHGPGDVEGQPIIHNDEYTGFLLDAYLLDEKGRRMVDSAFLSRPKGANKSGLAAEIALFEALGPCRFAGWAEGGEEYEFLGHTYTYQKGEPMGRPVTTPLIRIMATEEGQPLALDTQVATPTGWSTMREISVGDYVINSKGLPQRVARETPVFEGLDTYRVTFDNGEQIVASASHKWTVEERGAQRKYHTVTLTTEQLSERYITAQGENVVRIPVTPAWELPEQQFEVDPYFLGLWLGDGKTADSSIVFHNDDVDESLELLKRAMIPGEELVVRPSAKTNSTQIRIKGSQGRKTLDTMRNRLRSIGVLGDKHIPMQYLRGSVEQRMELLRGLLDSDGSTPTAKGRVSFVNTNDVLIEQVQELLTSLGYKHWTQYKASHARVQFTPHNDRRVFNLRRKYEKQIPLGSAPRSKYYRVVGVEKIDSVPVKCIGIDSEDHLFAAGKTAILTHNTGNVYDLCYENLLVDNGYPLADLNAYGMDVNRGLIRLPFGGEIMPSTTGSASKDGGKETFVVFDETHLYNTPGLRDMYKTVTRNLVKRKRLAEPWFIETTTMYSVGEDSIAESSYEYADLVEEGKTRRDKVLFDHRWGQIEDLSDEESLRVALEEAYGGALDWMDMESLIDDIFDPRRSEVESRRYFLNTLTSASNAWLEHVELELVSGQREVVKDGTEEVVLGFDGALTRDATALVACRLSDGYIWPLKIEEQPDSAEAKDWVVDQEGFDAAVYQAHIDYKVRGFFADPPHWQDYLDKWEREFGETWIVSASTRGSKIKFWTARDTTMDRALERFHTNITTQRVVISTDKTLQRHILNARTQNRRGGTVITKETKNSPKKIDAAMAATLAHEARAVALNEEVEEEETWVPRRVR